MDWTQYFVDLMNHIPGGYAILGIIGGGVIMFPFIPKITAAYKTFKQAKADEKKAEEDRKKQEDEDRLQQIAEEREFRRKVTEIMDSYPKMAEEITTLSEAALELKRTNKGLSNARNELADNITSLTKKVDKLGEDVARLEKASTVGDERLRKSINAIDTNLESVTKSVNMIIESDLDEFRGYLIDMHNEHVYGNKPLTKRDIEVFCLKFKKYKSEGGNGWAERMYYEILQSETEDGMRAEDVAKQFHYLIDTKMTDSDTDTKETNV